jgi:hypothetical protein
VEGDRCRTIDGEADVPHAAALVSVLRSMIFGLHLLGNGHQSAALPFGSHGGQDSGALCDLVVEHTEGEYPRIRQRRRAEPWGRISFYTATSMAPGLLIVIAVTGLAVGRDPAQNGVTAQLSGLMGQQTADVLQNAIASASNKTSGILADNYRCRHVDCDGVRGIWRNAVRPKRYVASQAAGCDGLPINSRPYC